MKTSSQHKPHGYSTVSPYLVVNGADATVDFLARVFDATKLRRFATGDGKVIHSEVRIEDTVIMIADAAPMWPALPSHVHIYVADADATYRKALNAGAISVQMPTKRQDENKRGAVKDSSGTTWWIATKVE
ncbi:MAG TPA: VOC family protein [Candidatus Angelobacter sp.]|nr:VOC family protein [Candidatus Angelobacter sp.]